MSTPSKESSRATARDVSQESQAPHRPPDDNETVYFDGRGSLWGQAFSVLMHSALALVLLGVSVFVALAAGGWGWLLLVPGLFASAAVAFWPLLLNRTRRYRITNYRIDFERGILTRRIDTLELWHVDDIRFRQTLLERLVGIGTLTVVSDDDTTPILEIHGLRQPRELFDVLKQRVISVKRQRGVVKLDL